MTNRTDQLEERVVLLERAVHRLLLVIGAAGALRNEIRHDEEGDQ
jgi:hypothetical protein